MPYARLEITLQYLYNGDAKAAPIVSSSGMAYEVIGEICNKKTILWTEEMLMLCLNSGNKLLGWYPVATGGTDAVNTGVRTIATIAALSTASRVILAHNHPSGSLIPSRKDIEATEAIRKGLKTIGADLIDHIIFTEDDFMSMKEGGFM